MASDIGAYIRNKRIKIGEGAKTAFTLIGVGASIAGPIIIAYVTHPLILGGSQEQPAGFQGQYTAAQNFGSQGGAGNAVGNNLTIVSEDTGSSGGVTLEDLLSGQGGNGGLVTSSINGLDAIIVQAGFLSDTVSSYSNQGFGGMKASLPRSSNSLNYFYLIIKDSEDNIVKFSPYEHGTKYTLMTTSFDNTVFFTWDNRLLPPGKYTAITAKGPQTLFNDTKLQILEQRQFEVRPYDFKANNAQNPFSDGYSMYVTKDSLIVLAQNRRSSIIDVRIYGSGGNIVLDDRAMFTRVYQFDFNRNKRNKVPLGDYRAEVVITYEVWDNAHSRNVERRALLAAQFPGKK